MPLFAQNVMTNEAVSAPQANATGNGQTANAPRPQSRRENLNLTEKQTAFLNHLLDKAGDDGLIGEEKRGHCPSFDG